MKTDLLRTAWREHCRTNSVVVTSGTLRRKPTTPLRSGPKKHSASAGSREDRRRDAAAVTSQGDQTLPRDSPPNFRGAVARSSQHLLAVGGVNCRKDITVMTPQGDTFAVRSQEEINTCCTSAENTAEWTSMPWTVKVTKHSPEAANQTFAVTWWPSSENTAELTHLSCPVKVNRHSPVAADNTFAVDLGGSRQYLLAVRTLRR